MPIAIRVCSTLVLAFASSLIASSLASALPRTTVDRVDASVGKQLHFVYAIPRDGEDRALDTSGVIDTSVASFQAWLADQTEGRSLRTDRFDGSLDITFVQLAETDEQIAARDPFIRDYLETDLDAAGLDDPAKIYAVYYDGSSSFACGGATWPPVLPGNVVAFYLKGFGGTCDDTGFAGPGAPPAYLEFAMFHDVLHALGFVPTCAPHHHRSGHVSDDPNDLMWAGTGDWMPDGWGAATLDAGRDDYYKAEQAGCLDLDDSELLTAGGPDCSGVTATPSTITRVQRDHFETITLAGATDPDQGDTLTYLITAVTQDEPVSGDGIGDDTAPDARVVAGSDHEVSVRTERSPMKNGRSYRIAYTVSDGQTACADFETVSVPRKKGETAADDGDLSSWDSVTGARLR